MAVDTRKYLPAFSAAVLMVAGYAAASDAAARHADVLYGARAVAEKIMAFENASSKKARFSFENYSFKSLDAAVQGLFPPGTPLGRVDAVLKGEGKAVKTVGADGLIEYTQSFKMDRWDCVRTVTVQTDAGKRVVSARGDGACS